VRNQGTIHIRIELESDLASQFEAIKKHLGLKLNTEVVRALIRNSYKENFSQSPNGATLGPQEQSPLQAQLEASVTPKEVPSIE